MNGRTNSNSPNTVVDASKSPFATLPPSDLVARRGNQKIDIGWTNPVTEKATPSGYVVAKRAYTLLIRNDDHVPVDRSDGIEIYRDTNTEEGSIGAYNDDGLTNGKLYHYGLISVTDNDVPSEVAEIENVPSNGVIGPYTIDPLSRMDQYAPLTSTGRIGDDYIAFVQFHPNGRTGGYPGIDSYNSALVKQYNSLNFTGIVNSSYRTMYTSYPLYTKDHLILAGVMNETTTRSYATIDSSLTLSPNSFAGLSVNTAMAYGPFESNALFYGGGNWNNSSFQFQRILYAISQDLVVSSTQIQPSMDRTQSRLTEMNKMIFMSGGLEDKYHNGQLYEGNHYNVLSNQYTVIQSSYFASGDGCITTQNGYKMMVISNNIYFMYNCGYGDVFEIIDDNLTKQSDITSPFMLDHASSLNINEYNIIIDANGTSIIAYDRYQTRTNIGKTSKQVKQFYFGSLDFTGVVAGSMRDASVTTAYGLTI